MKIAVVGGGIAGNGAAWLLAREHEVVLFEREARLGGHTHTHRVELQGREYAVDTGFIVYNPLNYPLFTRLLDELGVDSLPTTMGFSVQDARNGLEYNATNFDALFCQRGNLLSPRFFGMVRDIMRFYRVAPALLAQPGPGPTLGSYLYEQRYSRLFIEDHLVPMACALWSSPSAEIMRFPAQHLVRFMANHQMLESGARPAWRVLRGGSSQYLQALRRDWRVQLRLSTGVEGVRRTDAGVVVRSAAGEECFDQVLLACHSDEALALLENPRDAEREVLGALRYQRNDTVLHTDARLLPKRRKAWAAWNAYIPADAGAHCTVSYCMNLLQSLDAPEPLVVSLNRTQDIDPEKILARMAYAHPLQDHASVAAQARRAEINGVDRIWYAGAYWGYGFHEDGLRSGVEVARALGVAW
jgi:predicted NAD/FAD-binding protein